jgi:hypothetical protein
MNGEDKLNDDYAKSKSKIKKKESCPQVAGNAFSLARSLARIAHNAKNLHGLTSILAVRQQENHAPPKSSALMAPVSAAITAARLSSLRASSKCAGARACGCNCEADAQSWMRWPSACVSELRVRAFTPARAMCSGCARASKFGCDRKAVASAAAATHNLPHSFCRYCCLTHRLLGVARRMAQRWLANASPVVSRRGRHDCCRRRQRNLVSVGELSERRGERRQIGG